MGAALYAILCGQQFLRQAKINVARLIVARLLFTEGRKKIGALFFYFAGGVLFKKHIYVYVACVTWKRETRQHRDWALGTSPITDYNEWRI